MRRTGRAKRVFKLKHWTVLHFFVFFFTLFIFLRCCVEGETPSFVGGERNSTAQLRLVWFLL